MNHNELIDAYIRYRDKKAAMKAEFDKSVAKIDDLLTKIEAKMLQHFNETGSESVRTAAGTAYKTLRTSASVADREAFLNFVRENDAWELLETRAAKKAVDEFRAANEDLPPGINWNAETVVNIRRSA